MQALGGKLFAIPAILVCIISLTDFSLFEHFEWAGPLQRGGDFSFFPLLPLSVGTGS